MSEAETPTFDTNESEGAKKYVGRVKWFNNRAGYGFITVTEGDLVDEDLFVHHSAINVSSEQYKYLVEGEYINFEKIVSENTEHKFQAGNVTGVAGGQLMCETRSSARAARNDRSEQGGSRNDYQGRTRMVGGQGRGRGGKGGSGGRGEGQRVYVRGSGPREGEEWFLVKRKARVNDQERYSRGSQNTETIITGVTRGERYPEGFAN